MAECVVDYSKKILMFLWGFQVMLLIQRYYVGLIYIGKFNTIG
jgi:hypothetical protein